MTGFGKATLQLPTKKITVEIKSLNSKGLDLNTRMPSVFREMELGLRNQISARLERGKIDFSLYVEITGEETSSKINVPIVRGYINQMKAVIPNADETELMKMAVRMPDALKTERDEIDENEWKKIQTVIDEALENIAQFRKDEGVSLEREFLHRIANIMALMNNAVSYDAERVETVKTRLQGWLNNEIGPKNRIDKILKTTTELLDKLPELPEMINRANKAMELLSSYEFIKNQNQSNEYEIKQKSSKLKKTYLIIGLLIIVIILLIVFK